ncbi:MAG: DUF1998 domain-containing protein [Deltaproteobacteria bacterium]|nr:DUF1998 domain-containing protein [Deltaproteobacteria bacterium]
MTPQLLSGWMLFAGWILVIAIVAGGWLVAVLAVGDKPPTPRTARAALAMGPALATLAGLVAAFGVITSFASPGGAMKWLDAVVGPGPSGAPRGTSTDAMMALALIFALVLVVLWLGFSLRERGMQRSERIAVPHANVLAGILVVSFVLLAAAGAEPLIVLGRSAALIDVIAAAGVMCLGCAVWTRARNEAPRAKAPEQPRMLQPAAPVDVLTLWQQVGALMPNSAPLISIEGRSAPVAGGSTAELWSCVGALGPPPVAFDEIQAQGAELQGWIVGDLPDPTEQLFLAALILRTIHQEGKTCLVVTEDVRQDASGVARCGLRDRVEDGMRAAGLWSCGPLVVGDRELREAIAGRRMPAAAFLNVSELSAQGIRTLGRTEAEHGALWARQVGLVIVARFDRGTPVAVTHRVFTLRRLGLALSAAGAKWSVVATALGGGAARSLFEQIFPGMRAREARSDLRASAPVQVWAANPAFLSSGGIPWVRRAAEPVVRAGLSMSVSDPLGNFDLDALEVQIGKVRLERDIVLDGDASAGQLSEAWFLATLRALSNRLPLPSGGVHYALWGLDPSPVVRFLTRPGTLDWLARQSRPPALRPIVGFQNRLLARAHLHAALREGEQDLASLVGLFGRTLVDQAIGADFVPTRHALRSVPSQSGVVRVPLAPAMAGDVRNPLRNTVTDDVVRIMDRNSGRMLFEADRVTVESHYYPGRVFAAGPSRYEVPLHAYDARRGQIDVEPVDASRPLTRPILGVQISQPELVESPTQVTSGRLIFALSTYEATVVETVSGVLQADGRVVNYAPTTSQYRTRVRAILFPGSISPKAHLHLAASIGNTLPAHMLATEEEMAVVPLPAAFVPAQSFGVGVVDRFVQGMGVAEALDAAFVEEVMVWVRAILAGCPCPSGCHACSPIEVASGQGDKEGVLAVLGA